MADRRRTLELTEDEKIVYKKRIAGKSTRQVMEELELTYTQVTNRFRKAQTKIVGQQRLALSVRKIRF